MVYVYADLVEKGFYTVKPEDAVAPLKAVPSNLRTQVEQELANRQKAREEQATV